MLSDSAIRRALAFGDFGLFDPSTGRSATLDDNQLQPVSVDLRLGDVRCPGWGPTGGTRWLLGPRSFVLASTFEVVTLSHRLAGVVAGKSTIARRGLQVEAAGLVDPGFSGQLTLELINFTDGSIELAEGMRICQLVLHRVEGAVRRPYGTQGLQSQYQGQRGPTAAGEV